MAALAADDLWHDQFKCLPDPQHNGVPLDPVEKIPGDIRDHRGCSNMQFSVNPNGVQEPQVLWFPQPFAAQLRTG